MWKKFIAVMAIVGLFGSSIALASPNPAYLTDPTFSTTTLNPNAGGLVVQFDLLQAAHVQMYAISRNTGLLYQVYGTVSQPAYINGPQHISATWYGKTSNSSTGTNLPDGIYDFEIFVMSATDVNDHKAYFTQPITVQSAYIPPAPLEVAPKVLNLKATPTQFAPKSDDSTEISFDVDKDGYITVVIKDAITGTVVKTFADYKNEYYRSSEDHSIDWDGRNDNGDYVTLDRAYNVIVTTKNDQGENTYTLPLYLESAGSLSNGAIENFKISPSTTWDPTDEELEISFELNKDVKSLTIDAKRGNEVIEILDEDDADNGDYEETWDGTDEDGDYVKEGSWQIIVRADGNSVSKTVNVKFEQPEITEGFVTKESFDPDQDEFTNLVYKVSADSNVTVEVFKGGKKINTLLDEESVDKNKWNSIAWDGTDDDGDEVDFGKDYKFKVIAENATDNDVKDTIFVEVDVEEDDTSSKNSNVTNDYTDPVIFYGKEDSSITVAYSIDETAEIFLAVYEGKSASGKEKIKLLDYVSQSAGEHTVKWNGLDKNKKKLKDGIYSYKLISKVGSHKETEIGKFVVGKKGTSDTPTPTPTPVPGPKPTPTPYPTNCGGYWDTEDSTLSGEMCEAIGWATDSGIFSGYADGSFGAHNDISRGEVVKVVLLAFGVNILPSDGTVLGFNDVDPKAWYMPYIRTAKSHGMFHGYENGNARVYSTVNKAELLKIALEASRSFTGYQIPVSNYSNYGDVDLSKPEHQWFKNYAAVAYNYMLLPERYMGGKIFLGVNDNATRGEVALLLYRMYQNGLLGSQYYSYNVEDSGYLWNDSLDTPTLPYYSESPYYY